MFHALFRDFWWIIYSHIWSHWQNFYSSLYRSKPAKIIRPIVKVPSHLKHWQRRTVRAAVVMQCHSSGSSGYIPAECSLGWQRGIVPLKYLGGDAFIPQCLENVIANCHSKRDWERETEKVRHQWQTPKPNGLNRHGLYADTLCTYHYTVYID